MDRARHQRTGATPGYRKVGAYHGIEEYELVKNGLTVLYRHDDTAPVAGLMVTYLVGSRHEAVGYTGATHLLEHLMFKGSKQYPPKRGVSAMDLFTAKGALVNASTWLDRTNYYEVLPEEHLEFAVALEADRMRHAIITEKDRAAEMPAVRSEFAMRVANVPEEYLDERIWAAAFMAHPYHHPTIGWQSDFERVSTERLKHFYETYYWPNNAVVTITGPMDRARALALVKKYFGVHPRSPHPIPEPYTEEPPQTGRRFVEVNRAGTKSLVGVAFKVPQALHADTPALLALASILADGKTSRLYRALVEKGWCSSVHTVYLPFRDPSIMTFYATLASRASHAQVERAMHREFERIARDGVAAAELTRVLASIETEMAFARDGHFAMLSVLNEAIAVGDWKYFFDLPAALRKVTRKAVQDVAARYLLEHTMTVGHYKATADAGAPSVSK